MEKLEYINKISFSLIPKYLHNSKLYQIFEDNNNQLKEDIRNNN